MAVARRAQHPILDRPPPADPLKGGDIRKEDRPPTAAAELLRERAPQPERHQSHTAGLRHLQLLQELADAAFQLQHQHRVGEHVRQRSASLPAPFQHRPDQRSAAFVHRRAATRFRQRSAAALRQQGDAEFERRRKDWRELTGPI